MPPFRTAFAGVCAFLLAALGMPLFRVATLLHAQVETPRMLGVVAVFAAVLFAAAVPATLLLRRLPVWTPGWRHVGQTALVGMAAYSAALIGLVIYFMSPLRAPRPWLAAAAIIPLLVAARFAALGEEERALFYRPLRGLGVLLLALPIAMLPYVAYSAATDQVRLTGAPNPPAGAAIRPDAPKRIVLVTFDSLQIQSTGVFDPALDTTPHMDALAREGTAYNGVRAAADLTIYATPAILSGMPPGRTVWPGMKPGAVNRAGSVTSLAGHLAPAGYASGAFTMAIGMRTLGFDEEFTETFHTSPAFRPNTLNVRNYLPLAPALDWIVARATGRPDVPDPRFQYEPFATREVFTRGRAFLERHRDQRSFVWVHIAVPHHPAYDIPPPGVVDDPMRQFPRYKVDSFQLPKGVTLEEYRRIYRNYLRFGDAELGRFIGGLKAAGLYDDAMVIVSADHGEGLTAVYPMHGQGVITEGVTRVPLVVRPPGGAPARRDERLASSIDIVPSVLERVYETIPAGFPGRSLWRDAAPDRAVHTWAMVGKLGHGGRYRSSLATYAGPYRYVAYWERWAAQPAEWLVDLRTDPEGLTDIASRHPDVVARLRAAQQRDNALERRPD